MNRSKILIVSRSFYPVNSPRSLRTTELAKEFAKTGHKVTVLTPKNKLIHGGIEKKWNITVKDLGQPAFNSIEVRGTGVRRFLRKVIRRVTNFFFQFPDIEYMFRAKFELRHERGYDMLISIAAPHSIHWGVAWAWKDEFPIAKTWIADCGDPFMGARNDTFGKPFYFSFFEKWFCKKAHFITVPVKEAIPAYYKEFHKKIKVIPQGFSFPAIVAYKKNPVCTFVYSGSIGPYLHYAKDFFSILKEIDQEFNFLVFTKEKELILKEKLAQIDSIEIYPYAERKDLIRILSTADFLIHFPYKDYSQQSLKLVDYYYSQRPILSYRGRRDNETLTEFLSGEYEKQLKPSDIEIYKIENVANQFLNLSD